MLNDLKLDNWIESYVSWESSLIKDLGFEDSVNSTKTRDIKKSLSLNRKLLLENFIYPNKLKFPLFRNILENYFD
tara:strand:+ start:9331 stop:9555 length:225 start_codon:yes stop_codon:yes gene_type:complete